MRSLALGVNALLLFEPEQVVIESGDGTPGGTARMVRCLAAPVPLIFNGQPLFGWAQQRVPNLYGYKQTQSFDEGDLYGTIGLEPSGGEPSFALLTQGVWVQTYQHELLPNYKLGGVVCFDRLHKTVDHSGFVRDEHFEELWVRLRPYAEALVGGGAVAAPKITSVDGLAYTPLELREFLAEHPRIVAISPELSANQEDASWRGKSIARLLDAEVLRVDDSQIDAVRVLGERELLIWRPHQATLRISSSTTARSSSCPSRRTCLRRSNSSRRSSTISSTSCRRSSASASC